MRSCVIIGGGQAGAQTAISARQAGYAGAITIVSAERHEPYERPSLTKEMLTDGTAPVWAVPAGVYLANEISLRLGVAAERVDLDTRRVHLADGCFLSFDDLVFATGGTPRRPQMPGGDLARTIRTIDDAQLLRAELEQRPKVVVIGGGVIGLEFAASARKLGCEVTLLEAAPRLMPRSLPEEASAYLARVHIQAGVNLRLKQSIAAVHKNDDAGFIVELEDGEKIFAGLVIAGVGLERSTELAKSAGVETQTGIIVDTDGQTSVSGVYAVGDVAEVVDAKTGSRQMLESWQNAQVQGKRVGQVLAGKFENNSDVPWFWTDQHGTNVQVLGQCNASRNLVCRGSPKQSQCSFFALDRESRIAGVVAFNAPRDISAARRLMAVAAVVDPKILADVSIAGPALVRLCTINA